MAQTLAPSWSRPYYRLARIQHHKKQYEKALENYNIALAIEPVYKEATEAKATCKSELGKFNRHEHMDPKYVASPIRHENMRRDGQLTHSDESIKHIMEKAQKLNLKETDVMQAHAYRDGILGFKQDMGEAKRLYLKAAEKGSAEAMYNLGCFYANGYCGPIDLKRAVEWWHKAALQEFRVEGHENIGVKEAESALGSAYLDGLGIEQDEGRAIKFMEKAAFHGHAGANNNLGYLYNHGGHMIAKDQGQAWRYYKAGALKGDENAMVNLGLLEMKELNVQEAKKWIFRAADKGNHLANELIDEYKWRDASTEDFDIDPKVKELMKQSAKMLNSSDNSPHTIKNRESFPIEELAKFAPQSKIATKLLEAKVHSLDALTILIREKEGILDNLQQMKAFAHHSALCYHITEIVVTIPRPMLPLITKIYKRILEKESNNTEAMIGLLLNSSNFDEKAAMIKGWIAKGVSFPRLYELQGSNYAFMGKTKEALAAFSKAIETEKNPELYYDRATVRRNMDQVSECIADYEIFLKHTDSDDRKIPNAYFGMALCLMRTNFKLAEEHYKTGCEKAKALLPFFRDQNTLQESVARLIQMMRTVNQIKSGENIQVEDILSMGPISSQNQRTEKKEDKFLDPRRIEIIVQDRQRCTEIRKHEKEMKGKWMRTTTTPPRKQPPISSLANLKSMTIDDMDLCKDHVYEGYILPCTILAPFSVMTGAYTLVEDEKGEVERLGLYNFGFETNRQAEVEFWVGKKISIINPYLRIGMDDRAYIRVDNPNTVIIHSTECKTVCALCLADGSMKCGKCKAFYCSKKCQEIDWKIYKHKLICG
eukprot:Phypoly_transcript_02474.p1 GENE.Phypoly_transcript_02474~~Phypoly_transcript_02474.p1  ORF type:complete len:892 (+),score=143.23 Phypoly_transcript_02474:206-2677(+)